MSKATVDFRQCNGRISMRWNVWQENISIMAHQKGTFWGSFIISWLRGIYCSLPFFRQCTLVSSVGLYTLHWIFSYCANRPLSKHSDLLVNISWFFGGRGIFRNDSTSIFPFCLRLLLRDVVYIYIYII